MRGFDFFKMDLPKKFTDRMKNMLGKEYDNFYKAYMNSPVYSGIRVNTLKNGAFNTIKKVTGELEKVSWCDNGFYIDKSLISGNHPFHCAGLFYFQEPSAMSVVEGLPVNENDKILDLCAAPGGKSIQAGEKLKGSGFIVSNEIVKKRADILCENIERMGLTNAIVTNENPQRLSEKYPSFFDKIIVDAPCSGEGMFRKEPRAIEEWSIEHTISCGIRQKNILDCAVKMLKKDGMLIYSTCTFAPEENEKIVSYLIDTYNMKLIDMPKLYMLEEGKTQWSGSNHDMSKARRIFPQYQKGEGHFAALLQKCSGEDTYIKENIKPSKNENEIKLWKDFEKQYMNTSLDGDFVLFGENLYLKPRGIDIDKIKVVRCGLNLGKCKKHRFEPAHALTHALKKEDFKYTEDFDYNDNNIKSYLTGNIINSDKSGWCVVCVNGYPLGWGKASGGILKNHYPKNLRLK